MFMDGLPQYRCAVLRADDVSLQKGSESRATSSAPGGHPRPVLNPAFRITGSLVPGLNCGTIP